MRSLSLIAAAVWLAAGPTPQSAAQESINDPANPFGSGQVEETHDPANPTSSPTTGGEQISDPANPLSSRGAETIETPYTGVTSESQRFTPLSWFSGDYRGRFFVDTGFEGTDEDVFLLENRLELRAKMDFSAHWRAVIEGRLSHRMWSQQNPDGFDFFVNGEGHQGVFEASLRDAYLSGRWDNVFLRIGNQSIVWGAGTISQPADVINPLDYRGGTLDTPGDQRVPVFGVEWSAVFDRVGLSAVLVPFFQPHQIDVFGTDFAFFSAEGGLSSAFPIVGLLEEMIDPSVQPQLQEALIATEFPQALPENVSAGGRITSTYGGVDLGLGYFFGWDRTPVLEIDPDMGNLLNLLAADGQFLRDFDFIGLTARNPEFFELSNAVSAKAEAGDTLFSSTFARRHTVEFDLATYLGQLGVRLETAFTPKRTQYLAGFEGIRRPVLNSALALSYERSEDLNIQVEGFWVHTFDVPEGAKIMLTGEDFYGVIAVVSLGLGEFDGLRGTVWEDFDMRMAGIGAISTGDMILYPSLSYAFSDATVVSLGGMIFRGDGDTDEVSIGTLYDANDQAYISVDSAF